MLWEVDEGLAQAQNPGNSKPRQRQGYDKVQADLDGFQLGVVKLPLQVLHKGLLRYLWRPQPVQAQL